MVVLIFTIKYTRVASVEAIPARSICPLAMAGKLVHIVYIGLVAAGVVHSSPWRCTIATWSNTSGKRSNTSGKRSVQVIVLPQCGLFLLFWIWVDTVTVGRLRWKNRKTTPEQELRTHGSYHYSMPPFPPFPSTSTSTSTSVTFGCFNSRESTYIQFAN